jgi:hypothetical protein
MNLRVSVHAAVFFLRSNEFNTLSQKLYNIRLHLKLFVCKKKSPVPHAKQTWKYTAYICIADKEESI